MNEYYVLLTYLVTFKLLKYRFELQCNLNCCSNLTILRTILEDRCQSTLFPEIRKELTLTCLEAFLIRVCIGSGHDKLIVLIIILNLGPKDQLS